MGIHGYSIAGRSFVSTESLRAGSTLAEEEEEDSFLDDEFNADEEFVDEDDDCACGDDE